MVERKDREDSADTQVYRGRTHLQADELQAEGTSSATTPNARTERRVTNPKEPR